MKRSTVSSRQEDFKQDQLKGASNINNLSGGNRSASQPDGEEDDRCDLDPSKICDNCFKCLDSNIPDYEEIAIGEIIMDMDEHAFDIANTPFQYGK